MPRGRRNALHVLDSRGERVAIGNEKERFAGGDACEPLFLLCGCPPDNFNHFTCPLCQDKPSLLILD